MIKLAPSILSADFTKLGEEIKIIEKQNIPYLHIDVMDGHFVPNISIGIPVIKSIRKTTKLILDVHLMISNPELYIEDFADAGADIINIHYEACQNKDIKSIIESIKSFGKKAAVTINPETSCESLFDIIKYLDMVLVMSVNPGFGGQKFIDESLIKINKISDFMKKNNFHKEIEIDGGVNINNIRSVIGAGANIIVVGSAIFNANNKELEIQKYQEVLSEYEDK